MTERLRPGDRFIAKKPHPCGGSQWEVAAAGVDFKLRCLKCGRTLVVEHDKAYRMIKTRLGGAENGENGKNNGDMHNV